MRSLVIGGTGFIGLNIVRALQAEGLPVTCTRRPSSNTLFLRKLAPRMVTADCMDLDSMAAAMDGIDAVFMVAGHYPRYSVKLADQVAQARAGLRNVLEAAQNGGVKRFIYTSSVTTETATGGNSVYFAVKKAMESEVLESLRNGLSGTVLCPSACMGPYDVKVGTGGILVGAVTGRLPYFADGKFNIVDVEDVARAHVAALKAPVLKERYVLAQHNTTVSEFLSLVSSRYSAPMPRKLPMAIAYPRAFLAERYHYLRKTRAAIPLEFIDMLRHGRHYDASDARSDLGMSEGSMSETLDKAYEWFKKYKYFN